MSCRKNCNCNGNGNGVISPCRRALNAVIEAAEDAKTICLAAEEDESDNCCRNCCCNWNCN